MFENVVTLNWTTLSWRQLLHPPLSLGLLLTCCTVVVVSSCFLCLWILSCVSGPVMPHLSASHPSWGPVSSYPNHIRGHSRRKTRLKIHVSLLEVMSSLMVLLGQNSSNPHHFEGASNLDNTGDRWCPWLGHHLKGYEWLFPFLTTSVWLITSQINCFFAAFAFMSTFCVCHWVKYLHPDIKV